ncbi:hypothetical protein KA082_02090 [Candidatus Woesebacteria bacterium]|nr:hypothetical protein [Candidatus Woesebacteria bacterium]
MKKKFSGIFLILCLVFNLALSLVLAEHVQAAQAAGASYVRCDRMKAATAPGTCLVVFTTSSATNTEAFFKITLDSEFVSATNFSTTAGNYTISTSGIPAGTTAMPGIATATSVTSQTIAFPMTAAATSTQYAFFITGSGLILNPAASTTILHTIFTTDSGGTVLDTKDVAVPTISDDQIAVTASVAPTFTFVFASNTQALGTLSSSAVVSGTGVGITITTNAPNGWNAWVKSANVGLTSANASKTITSAGSVDGTPTTLSTGSEDYVLDADLTTNAAGGGTPAIAAEYDGTTTSMGGTLSSSYQSFASSSGTANGDVITLVPRVTIAGVTPAGSDYTDTLTVVGAGIF